jgi:transglutaminase-like putative cysteine protease
VWNKYDEDRWWPAENDSVLHFPDDGFLEVPKTIAREVITQTVVTYLPNSSLLYAAPEVIGSSKQMFVEASPDENGLMAVTALRSRYVLRQGDRYKAVSRVSNADAQSLRTASTNYPDWIEDTYLQLPDTITPETVALAEELTADYNNPFDKAIAVRDWLRTHIDYNDQIPAPPENAEPVHHILFVTQEGYCNYYASAMAVMLRSQGVPSRVVSGYAQGEFDNETNSYRVRASNAHTWVEVFFPAYGWIQFEPTAALPVDTRPENRGGGGDAFDSPSNPEEGFERGPGDEPQSEQDRLEELLAEDNLPAEGGDLTQKAFPVWQIVGAVLVVLIAGGTLVVTNEMNQRVEADVERSYGRLGSWARWLGVLFRPTQTPYERADLMATAVPEGKAPIRSLTRQFVLKQFSPARAIEDGFDSQKEWQQLRPLLLRRIAINRLKGWQAKLSREKSNKTK